MKRLLVLVLAAALAGAFVVRGLFDSNTERTSDADPRAGGDAAISEPVRESAPIPPDGLDRFARTAEPAGAKAPETPEPTGLLAPAKRRAGRIHGRVLDADSRQPLNDARVIARREDGEELEIAVNVAGAFIFDDLLEDEECEILASAPEHATASAAARAASTATRGDEILLELEPARALRGRVVDENGGGVAARLEIRRGARRLMVESGPDGAFEAQDVCRRLGLRNRPPEKIGQVWARSLEHRDAFAEFGREHVLLGAPLEIRVATGAAVAGRCVTLGDLPLPGVEVTCYPLDDSSFAMMRTSRTDSMGRFRIGGLGEGRHHVEVQPTFRSLSPEPRAIPCELGEHESLETLTFTFTEGYPIGGRVIARLDESPLRDRIVTLDHEDWLEPLATLTDHEGRFTFGPLPSGDYSVTLRGESWFDAAAPRRLEAKAGEIDLRFVVDEPPRDGALRLEVRDAESGAPLAAAPVEVRADFHRDEVRESVTRDGRTGDDGVVVIRRLPRALLRAQVSVAGFARSTIEFEITAPEQTVALEVSLLRGATIRGRVFDAAGDPIEGAAVGHFAKDDPDAVFDPESGTLTDEFGDFELRNVDPRGSWIAAYFDGLAPAKASIDPPGRDVSDLRITLAPGTSVSGFVFHENGAPARRFLVEFVGAVAASSAATDDRGRFEFLAVESGPFTLQDGDGFVLESGVASGEPLELELVVPDR